MNSELRAGVVERTIPKLTLPGVAPKATARLGEAAGTGLKLKLFVRGLEPDERQLLDGLVRVSMRRSPQLELLEEGEASTADVILIGATDPSAVNWTRTQHWIDRKTVIWIGGSDKVAAGHSVIKRPVQWSILPSVMARALEHGPGSVHASRPTPLTSGHVPLASAQAPLTSGYLPPSSSRAPLTGRADNLGVSPRVGTSPILVVDDSLAIRNHLRSLLEAGGFAVSLADSVESALKMIEQKRFDCVLMDVLMPGVDGYEGCRQIKSTLRGDNSVPVVMLTSKSSPFDRIRGKMAGCDAYLTKPVDPQQLGEVLAQQLQF